MRIVIRTALSGALAVGLGYMAVRERDLTLALLGAWNALIFVVELRDMRAEERKADAGR